MIYNVSILRDFGNFQELKEIIFIGDQKPTYQDLKMKDTDKILKIVERPDLELIIKE